jgi:tetratricopeptide (TPR) repeat protein
MVLLRLYIEDRFSMKINFLGCLNIKGAEMRRLINVFIYFLPAVAILLHGCTYQGPVKEIITDRRISRADTDMEGSNYDDAITNYTKALKINPRNAIAYNNRGLAWGKKGDYDNAIADFSKAVEINPQYTDAYNNRGIAYYEKRKYDSAIADFTTAVEINPQYADAYKNRGIAYYDKGDYDSAIRNYNKAVEINPQYADAYTNRGIAYYEKKDYDRTCSDFQKSCELGNCKGLNWARKEGICKQ